MAARRALHYVLKIGDRDASVKFYRDLLGMKPLRHEEFEEGCAATCNGPYDNKWSKTMIGYGPEDKNFVLELTYNYTVGSYNLGNDLLGICLEVADEVFDRVKVEDRDGRGFVLAPDGYKFFYRKAAVSQISGVKLSVKNLEDSVKFWSDALGLSVATKDGKSAILSSGENQAKVELIATAADVDRATAFGRTAFAVPGADLKQIETNVKAKGYNILTPYVTLETPGKADVQVVIFADPDGHEICFVGDEGFSDLSQVDPKAGELLEEALKADDSKAWYEKEGKAKTEG